MSSGIHRRTIRGWRFRRVLLCVAGVMASVSPTMPASAELVPVRIPEGRVRGFLTLSDLDGRRLAIGELQQLADTGNSDRVTATLRFHFADGSLHDETAEYSQRRQFRLLAYHLVQKGPTFPRQLEVSLNVARGQVEIRSTDEGEATKTISEKMKLPADLANGLVTTLITDLDARATLTKVSLLATTPKPRLVTLEIVPDGPAPFTLAGSPFTATRYRLHVEIGGLAGAVAPLVGKQPPDTRIWILGGKAPGFLKSEGPLYPEGPIWRVELASPDWPKENLERTSHLRP